MSERKALELPCTVCGAMAVEITLPEVSAVARWGIAKMLRADGAAIDAESPTYGFTALQLANGLGVRCVLCVDGLTKDLQLASGE